MRPLRSLAPILICATLVLSAALGIRQTFGLYLAPIASAHIANLTLLSLAVAVQNLMWGFGQPFAGALADRYGPGPVIAGGGVMYAIGLLWVAAAPALFPIMLGFGVLAGLGQSAMTFAVVIAAVSRAAGPAQRSTAVALAAAGGSLGQVALVPVAQAAIDHGGFRIALVVMAGIALAAAPLGVWLRTPRTVAAALPAATSSLAAAATALRDPNFLFLTAGFFACGFQLAFIGLHLPGYLVTCHVGADVGAAALSTIGFFNIIGSFAFGRAADRVPPQLLLTALYAVRAGATVVYVMVPVTAATTLAFAVVMGLTWLGTVPLTNAVIARLHGLPNLGTLFGVCFVGHQAGSFLGALAGGISLALTGSYDAVWIATIAIGFAAALLNLPIRYARAYAPQAG